MSAKFTLAVLSLLGAVTGSAGAAEGVEDFHARNLAAGCASCHPASAGGPIPALAGRDRTELVQRLRAFRDGQASATVMHQIARGYTDDELERIAAHLSGSPR